MATFLRKSRHLAWLRVLLTPLKELHQDFLTKKIDLDFKTRFNSQQMLFTAFLNDKFDAEDRRIRVVTGTDALPLYYTYFKSENKAKRYKYFKSEGQPVRYRYFRHEQPNRNRFIVYVPTEYQDKEAQIRGWIDYYKLADKKYTIEWIS